MKTAPSRTGLLAVLFAAAMLTAQGTTSRRDANMGRVLSVEGRPVSGAEVVLFHAAGGLGGTADDDVVRTTTDAKGQFAAALLPTRLYHAFACHRTTYGAVVTSCEVWNPGCADLRFTTTDEVPSVLAIHGTAAWSDEGPLQVRVRIAGSSALVEPLPVDAQGHVALPPLPTGPVEVQVFARDRLMLAELVSLTDRIVLPPPRRVHAFVGDAHGKPIAGARLQQVVLVTDQDHAGYLRGVCSDQAVSDAQGSAELLFPCAADPFAAVERVELCFWASKSGHGGTFSGFGDVPFFDGERASGAAVEERTLRFTLRDAVGLPGRVLSKQGQPAPVLHLRAWLTLPLCRRSVDLSGIEMSVGRDGGFTLPALAGDWLYPRAVVVPACLPTLLGDDAWRRAVIAQPLLVPCHPLDPAIEVDLQSLTALRLRTIDAVTSEPLQSTAWCVPFRYPYYLELALAKPMVADREGRLAVPVIPGKWAVVAVTADRWGTAQVTVEGGAVVPPQTLRMAPMSSLPVRVVDAVGAPVENAWLEFTRPMGRWYPGDPLRELVHECAWSVNGAAVPRLRTDGQGRVMLTLLPTDGFLLFAYRDGRSSKPVRVLAGEFAPDLVIR